MTVGERERRKLPPTGIEIRHRNYRVGDPVPTHDFTVVQSRGLKSNHRDICVSNEEIAAYIKRTLSVNPNAKQFPYFFYEVT
jgi:hypothetical protein